MKPAIAFNNLYRNRCLAFIAFLLLSCQPTHAQLALGYVAFDCPNAPTAEFQFDLDKRVIALVTEDPGFKSIPLFKTLEALHLRHYRNQNVDLPEMHRYYREVLTERGWKPAQREPSENRFGVTPLYTSARRQRLRHFCHR